MIRKFPLYGIFILSTITMTIPLFPLFDKAKTLLVPARDQREEQLDHLQTELGTLQNTTKEEFKSAQTELEIIERNSNEIKMMLRQPDVKDQDFLNKKLSLFNEMQQVLFNNQFLLKELLAVVETHVKMLQEYTKDPFFKSLNVESRSFYTFETVQSLNRGILYQEDALVQTNAQKNDAQAELETRKKKLSSVQKEYQDKQKQQEEFGVRSTTPSGFTFVQQGELLDLERKLALYEKQLADLKVQEINRRLALLSTKVFVETEKLKVLKENLEKAKLGLRVSPEEVRNAQEKLEKKKQESLIVKDARYAEIKVLSAQRDKLKREFDIGAKRYGKVPGDLASWHIEPRTIDSFTLLSEMGLRAVQISLLDRKIEYLRAQIDIQESEYRREEIGVIILNTWYKITQRKFRNNDEVLGQTKQFKVIKEEAQRELAFFQDKRNAMTSTLNFQNKELSNIRRFIQDLQAERDLLFKKYPMRYNIVVAQTYEAEKSISEQLEVDSKLVEVYSSLNATFDELIKEVSFMLNELEIKTMWQRSEYAISWRGVKNIIPDLGYFFSDVKQLASTYFVHLTTEGFISLIRPFFILFLCIALILAILLYNVLSGLLPRSIHYLLAYKSRNIFVSFFAKAGSVLLLFAQTYKVGFFAWACLLFLIYSDAINDLFLHVLFYLISIPYLIYFAYLFIKFIKNFNVQHGYPLFHEHFERRFTIVFSLFLYSTILVLFFREAFMVATLHKSELPTILLAVYSLLVRALIIFSIGKDEVLSLISTQGHFGALLSRYINTYYYPLLVVITTIMIISDPYVGGYSALVSYIIWGLIATLVLIKGLFWLHVYVKRWSSQLFFYSDEEVRRERFVYAKTSYGLFVIGLFVCFLLVGLFLGARIWGIRPSLKDISGFFHVPLFETGFDKVTGQVQWFTPMKLFIVVGFILGGFILALAINRIVYRAIFNVLPIDLGIQNTVTSLTRYFILIAAIYLGFQWGGIGTLLIAIGVVIGSIGYIVKEPIGDFVSYFIILVQRPIQIGDYIFLDEENQGIVRKITPRSVIMRRKDSYTIIIPNSMILSKPVCNWNYTKGYVAFDDIEFTVPFTTDPVLVKTLIARVLDANTDLLKSPKPIIRLHEFGEYGFVFKVRGFTSDINTVRKWDIASEIRFALVRTFKEHGISIALPTRVIVKQDQY